MRVAVAFVICTATLIFSGRPVSSEKRAQDVHIQMKNVRLHPDDGIVLDVQSLDGVMISRSGAPPVFDDQRSYVLQVDSAELSLTTASLQTLLNRYVFGYDGAPLKDIKLGVDGDRLKISATLKKGVGIPISAKARIAAAADGRMELHVDSMKALGIPTKGLLNLFGLKLDDLVSLKNRRGIDINEYDILIAPGQVLPPPEIRGRISRVRFDGDRVVQTFGTPGKPTRRISAIGRNYIYFGGGVVTFGKLTMNDADLQLIDADPKDPFDFFPARYQAQLVAGYSKTTPARGLRTYMPDYDDLRRRR